MTWTGLPPACCSLCADAKRLHLRRQRLRMIQDVVCAKLLHPILRFGARGGRDHRQVGALARDLHCDGSNAASAAETASLVSRRLARLEEELGIQLLARTTRGATLTEAGGAFRDYAMGVCAGLDAVREAILPEEDLQGLLRITAPLSFVPTIFAPVIADMAVQHPRLQIHASYSDHYVDLVGGGFDCGIRVGYLEDSNLIAKRVGPIYGSLVASPAYVAAHGAPETLEEFLDHEVLMHGTEAWQLMDGDKAVMVRPQGRLKADNIIALMTAAIAGLGIARLPDGIAHEHLASGALIRVLPQHPLPIAGMFVVRPHSPHPARKVRVFTEMLQNFLGSCPFISKPYSDDQP